MAYVFPTKLKNIRENLHRILLLFPLLFSSRGRLKEAFCQGLNFLRAMRSHLHAFRIQQLKLFQEEILLYLKGVTAGVSQACPYRISF